MEPQDQQVVVNQPEPEKLSLFSRLKKRKKLVIVLLLIILAWLGLYVVTLFVGESDMVEPSRTMNPQVTGTPLPISELEDRDSWVSYESDDFSFEYPNLTTTTLAQEDDSVVLQVGGETQTEQTELFDGIGLQFEIINMEGMDLQRFARNRFDMYEEYEDRIVQGIHPVQIGDREGYEFIISGLGQTRHIYLQYNETQVLHISDYSQDPNNAGYASYVNEIISSLEY